MSGPEEGTAEKWDELATKADVELLGKELRAEMRELRGGSAQSDGWSIRAGARAAALRQAQSADVGFRVVMDVPAD